MLEENKHIRGINYKLEETAKKGNKIVKYYFI